MENCYYFSLVVFFLFFRLFLDFLLLFLPLFHFFPFFVFLCLRFFLLFLATIDRILRDKRDGVFLRIDLDIDFFVIFLLFVFIVRTATTFVTPFGTNANLVIVVINCLIIGALFFKSFSFLDNSIISWIFWHHNFPYLYFFLVFCR